MEGARGPTMVRLAFALREAGVQAVVRAFRIDFGNRLAPKAAARKVRVAAVMMDVDRTGQLVDVLVVAHTRREFADAALDAIKQWRFEPPLHKGRPVLVRVEQVFNFRPETQAAKSPL